MSRRRQVAAWSLGVVALGIAAAFGLQALRGGPAPDLAAKRARAWDLHGAERQDEALRILDEIAADAAPTHEDLLLRGLIAARRGDLEEAVAALDRIPDDSPNAAKIRSRQGRIERERNRVRFAEACYLRAVQLDPDYAPPVGELIYIYGMQLRRKRLAQQFHNLSKIRPMSFQEAFLWCLTRRNDWDPESVAEQLSIWLEADPDDRESRLALAENYRQLTRFDDALKALDRLPDDDPDARATRARVALDRGDAEAAESLLSEGPIGHAGLAKLRGRLALARRDWQGAATAFRAVLDEEPDERDALFGLGNALIQLGRADEGEPLLRSARDHDALANLVGQAANADKKDDPDLIRKLGEACETVGRYPEARAWYQLLIARDPLDESAQKALFRVDRRSK